MEEKAPMMNEPEASNLAVQFNDAVQQRQAATLGMWVFIATEVLFFGVLFTSYAYNRVAFPEAFTAGSGHTNKLFGTIETAVLLLSSCAVALAVRDIQLGGRRAATWLLVGTASLGITFLVMHGAEYLSDFHEGLMPGVRWTQTGPLADQMQLFYWLYYAITGIHSLHVTIGVVLLLIMAWRTHREEFGPRYHTPVEITALYWHLVDIVWIFVYPLMYLVS